MKSGTNVIHNKERISQVKIIFKQKLYLEIAGHVSELNRSKKKKFQQVNIFKMAKNVVRDIGCTTYRTMSYVE